jgi:hypothetical protein
MTPLTTCPLADDATNNEIATTAKLARIFIIYSLLN